MKCDGKIAYVEVRVVEFQAEVDDEGCIEIIRDGRGPDVLDVQDSSLWCSIHGMIDYDEYESHGISEYWEVV